MMPSLKSIVELYCETLSPARVSKIARRHHYPAGAPKYPPVLLFWLMIYQRLTSPGSLEKATDSLCEGKWKRLQGRCRKTGRWSRTPISRGTGGYCRARQRVPVAMIREMNEQLSEVLQAESAEHSTERAVYIIDGSSLQLQAEPELLDSYPPARNQHGRAHWPVMRLVVLHNAHTGLATMPVWAPMSGPRAESEQALAEQLMDRMPAMATLLGDCNFGIFSIAFAAEQRRHPVVLRLTKARARALAGGSLQAGTVKELLWRPSRWESKRHPELPADAGVPGRLIVCSAAGWRDVVCLFTTVAGTADEILALYRLRWNVETDLRSLKQTVHLRRLTSRSKAMVEKEICAAISAYNLVRTIIRRAAEYAGVDARRISFTRVLGLVNDFLPDLLACSGSKAEREIRRLILLSADCLLPQRRRSRSYPRAVWRPGYRYPARHSSGQGTESE